MSRNPVSILSAVYADLIGTIDVRSALSRFKEAKLYRGSGWDQRWKLIKDVLDPDHKHFQSVVSNRGNSSPSPTGFRQFNADASSKSNMVVSRLCAHAADPSVQWMSLKFFSPALLRSGQVLNIGDIYPANLWLDSAINSLYKLFSNPESNFYPSTHALYRDWYNLGTACREVIRRADNGKILFSCVSMEEIFIETGAYGDVSVTYRLLRRTPSQAYDIWGGNLSPATVEKALRNKGVGASGVGTGSSVTSPQTSVAAQAGYSGVPQGQQNVGFPSVSGIYQHDEYLEVTCARTATTKDFGIPLPSFMSYVIELGSSRIIDFSMHNSSPYIISRFEVTAPNVYGQSSVWRAMPAIKVLNNLHRYMSRNAAYAGNSLFVTNDITSINPSQISPGAIIQGLDMQGNPTFRPVPIGGGAAFLMDFIKHKTAELDDALLSRDAFAMDQSAMTATEARLREAQAMTRLRPMLIRLEKEDLNKTVVRSLQLLMESGQLDMFPYAEIESYLEKQGVNLPNGWLYKELPDPLSQIEIKFSGAMLREQRMQDLYNMDLLLERAAKVHPIDNEVFDVIDTDESMRYAADILGTPLRTIRSPEKVEEIRVGRRAQQQQQMQIQMNEARLNQQGVALDNEKKAKEIELDEQ